MQTFVKEFLNSQVKAGFLKTYTCNISLRHEDTSVFINGKRHTKAPGQHHFSSAVDCQFQLENGKVGACVFQGTSSTHFVEIFERAKKWALSVPHPPEVRSRHHYPALKLMSPALLEVFDSGRALPVLAQIAGWLDEEASLIEHPLLMNREVNASLTLSTRVYLDSLGNEATEKSASCSLLCSFSLVDSSEYFADALGILPTREDCRNVVAEAAKNMQKTEVRKFEPHAQSAVCLSPKAVVTLYSMLIAPNLEMRSILDGTGAYNTSHLGKKVLENVSLSDNPHLEFSPFSAAFDREGTPSKPVVLLENGILKHPLFTSALLAELEQEHEEWAGKFTLTGHADSADSASLTNTMLDFPGFLKASSEEMLAAAPQVVHISNLTGMSVDPLTGQFALDAEGAKVFEKGVLSFSTSVTLRGNFFQALAGKGNKVGSPERVYNVWAPEFWTSHLSCVGKEMASAAEDLS